MRCDLRLSLNGKKEVFPRSAENTKKEKKEKIGNKMNCALNCTGELACLACPGLLTIFYESSSSNKRFFHVFTLSKTFAKIRLCSVSVSADWRN